MSPARPRSASASGGSKDDDWATPGGWSGRAGSGAEPGTRAGAAGFSEFGAPQHSWRTAAALDLATPKPAPSHGARHDAAQTPQRALSAMMEHTGTRMLDTRGLARALGQDNKFAARLEEKMMKNTSMQRAFGQHVMGAVGQKGWGALHGAVHDETQKVMAKALSPKK